MLRRAVTTPLKQVKLRLPAQARRRLADAWNPGQYELFSDHRTRPGLELLQRVPLQANEAKSVIDVGCGTGRFTAALAQRFPQASVLGIDSSENMLQAARKAMQKSAPTVKFECRSADDWSWHSGRQADLIYANASLQWLPNHDSLFPKLMQQLRPGGVLAVQMPNNFREPSHALVDTLLHAPGANYGKETEAVFSKRPDVQPLEFYHHALAKFCDSKSIDIWGVRYLQLLTEPSKPVPAGRKRHNHPVCEWVKGTFLSPIMQAMANDSARVKFEDLYSEQLDKAYPIYDGAMPSAPRWTLFPFKRIFIVARKQ